jgi:hypothetical protein
MERVVAHFLSTEFKQQTHAAHDNGAKDGSGSEGRER